MKIALVFSGQPRFIKEHLIYQLNHMFFLSKYECDVYAHFWFSKDENQTYTTHPWAHLDNLKFDKDTIDIFNHLYAPRKIAYDKPLTTEELIKRNYPKPQKLDRLNLILSYLTSLKKAYDLIDNPEEYDFIIRMRTDILICRLPDLHSLSKTHLHLFDQRQGVDTQNISDAFYIVPPKYAKILFHQLDSLDSLYDMGCIIDEGGEIILEKQLEVNNLYQHSMLLDKKDFYYRFQRNGKTVHGLIGAQD
jgi:hypothetical protein